MSPSRFSDQQRSTYRLWWISMLMPMLTSVHYSSQLLGGAAAFSGPSLTHRGRLLTPSTIMIATKKTATTTCHTRIWMISKDKTLYPSSNGLDPLVEIMEAQGTLPASTQQAIINQMQASGLDTVHTALLFAQDFTDRPEILARVLISDFGFPPLLAHQTRAVLSKALMERTDLIMHSSNKINNKFVVPASAQANEVCRAGVTLADENDWNVWEANVGSFSDPGPIGQSILGEQEDKVHPPKTFKATRKPLVNVKQAERRKKTGGKFEYGLPSNCDELYPALAAELNDFYQFMTEPSISSQGEDPIRPATAKIYLRHAKLFLGWFVAATKNHPDALNEGAIYHPFTLSINNVIPTKQKESAQTVIDFIMWLRRERQVSASYEANLLRGIIKLLKFRFRSESEESSAALTFVDIPIIQELRKLHRTAEQKNRNGPISSDEQKKWLSWPEYLKVIEKTKVEVEQMRLAFEGLDRSQYRYRRQDEKTTARDDNDNYLYCQQQQEIAQAFQRYLILAIFACIPDRQRTIRELELGRTLIREAGNDCWVVKHGPDDYKTGDAYGERPPMQLAPELTTALDEFVEKWRPALRPVTNFLFVQAMTGQPLTADSVYQRVSQSCYKYTGQRTNPHLLRSMIITHVREVSNATEKDLEALALFMGHSIQMQRSSYDKRTLEKKIAPAVQLLQTVNRNEKKSLN